MFGIQTNFRAGAAGRNGWTPLFAIVALSANVDVFCLVDYTGGTGNKPTDNLGAYVGPTGYVIAPEDATNVKGAAGWSPVYASQEIGEKVVQKIVDWTGGTGAKPSLPLNPYLTPTGFGTAAQAVDIRGGAGKNGNDGNSGDNGWTPVFAPHYRNAIEVVLKLVGYTGGTGAAPSMPKVATECFVAADGSFVTVENAMRINPEDSFALRLSRVKLQMDADGILDGKIVNVINAAKTDLLNWIANVNIDPQNYTQMDAMTAFKGLFRNLAYFMTRGVNAETLATFDMAIVFPSVFQAIGNNIDPNNDKEYKKAIQAIFRAVIDFDGEIEEKYLLGDITNETSTTTLTGLSDALDEVMAAIS